MIVLVLGLVSEALAGLNDATAHTGDVNSIWLGWVLHVQSPSKLTRTTQEMRREEERGGISPYSTTRHTLLDFIIEMRVPQLAISTTCGGGGVSDPHTTWGGVSDPHTKGEGGVLTKVSDPHQSQGGGVPKSAISTQLEGGYNDSTPWSQHLV